MITKPFPVSLVLLLSALYFSQGFPFGFLTRALPALMRSLEMPVSWIGLLSLAAIPWVLKFAWAPWVDHWGRGRQGHRQRWIIGCQLLAAALLVVLGLLPVEQLSLSVFAWLMLCLLLLNTVMATHDVATDGLAVRLLPVALRGLGNSIQVAGYKLGLILGSALLLWVSARYGWQAALWGAAVVLLLLMLPVVRFVEPMENHPAAGKDFSWRELPGLFRVFWRGQQKFWWLWVLLLYKVGDSFGSRMIKPFLVDNGLSLEHIAALDVMASVSGLLALLAAGLLLRRLSLHVALAVFALLQALSFLAWATVSAESSWNALLLISCFEQMADGMATVALFTGMMGQCRAGHEGADYTLQACIFMMVAGWLGVASGFSVEAVGYQVHFWLAAGLSAVAIIPVLQLSRLTRHD